MKGSDLWKAFKLAFWAIALVVAGYFFLVDLGMLALKAIRPEFGMFLALWGSVTLFLCGQNLARAIRAVITAPDEDKKKGPGETRRAM